MNGKIVELRGRPVCSKSNHAATVCFVGHPDKHLTVKFRFDLFTGKVQFERVPSLRIKIYAAGSQRSRTNFIFRRK